MIRRTRKVWTGLGVASLAGFAGIAPVEAQSGHRHSPTVPPAATSDTGKMTAPASGEAYLTDGGPKDTRIRIYRDIGLMRGHLHVGRELIEQGEWDEALPHFLHPTEELYGQMERYIKLHKVTPFDRQLKTLAQAVKAKSKAAYEQAARVVDQRLTNALTAFKRFMTGHPPWAWAARTMVETLNVAKSEYEASIEDGRFVKAVEYEDSRGFVWFTEHLFDEYAAQLEKLDKASFDQMRAALAELKPAWPTPKPPPSPVMQVAAVAAAIEKFERAARPFHMGRIQ